MTKNTVSKSTNAIGMLLELDAIKQDMQQLREWNIKIGSEQWLKLKEQQAKLRKRLEKEGGYHEAWYGEM